MLVKGGRPAWCTLAALTPTTVTKRAPMDNSFIPQPLPKHPDLQSDLWQMHRQQMLLLQRMEALLQTLVAQGSQPAQPEPPRGIPR